MDFVAAEPRSTRRTARIECQVVRLSDFRLVADRVENLSPSGMLVGPADPVLTGDVVMVSFQLPGLRDWIDAEAVVTRVVHGRRPGETRRALGLEIVRAEDFARRLLGAYLRRLPPAPPDYRVTLQRGARFQRRSVLAAAGAQPA